MPLSHEAQALIAAFGQQPGVTRDHVRNLQQTVEASPALIQEVNHAVEAGPPPENRPVEQSARWR